MSLSLLAAVACAARDRAVSSKEECASNCASEANAESISSSRHGLSASAADVASYFKSKFGVSLATVFWGDMHTHTFYSQDADLQSIQDDGPTVTPATVYERARARGFSFSAVADHAEAPVPSNIAPGSGANVWESTRSLSRAANDETNDGNGVFIPFMGYEYTNPFPCTDPDKCPSECTGLGGNESCTGYGHKNVVFASLDGAPAQRLSFLDPALWNETSSCTGPRASEYCRFADYTVSAPDNPAIWSWLRDKGYAAASGAASKALTIIHTPGNIHHVDWGVIDAAFVRNVEIFSQWGNSEGPAPSTCALQRDLDVALPSEALNDEDLLIRPQLQSKWIGTGDERYALSFVGGSDDHSGNPGGDGIGNGGITGIVTPVASRQSFFDALYARRTVAATYYSNMEPLAVLTAAETGGKHFFGGDIGSIGASGKVTLRVQASASAEQLQLVVDGCTTRLIEGSSKVVDLALSATERHYVYVRARRKSASNDAGAPSTDYHQTWSSPIYLRPAGT